jgi:Phosphoenolpyruvate phosphomutase
LRMLEHLGFMALASTSAGFAWSIGRPDYALPRIEVLAHLSELSQAVMLPLNADFEAVFADNPEGVAESVSLAIATGVAGLSLEDRNAAGGRLYDTATSLERLKAAHSAIDQSGEDVVLVARTEGLLFDPTALKPAIEKLVAFADAGADCLFAPGVRDAAAIAQMVRAVAPKPLNVVMMRPGLSSAEFAGPRRPPRERGQSLRPRDVGLRYRRGGRDQARPLRRAWVWHPKVRAQQDVQPVRTVIRKRHGCGELLPAIQPNQIMIVPYNPASGVRRPNFSTIDNAGVPFWDQARIGEPGDFGPEYAYKLHVHLIQFKKQFSRVIRAKNVMIV